MEKDRLVSQSSPKQLPRGEPPRETTTVKRTLLAKTVPIQPSTTPSLLFSTANAFSFRGLKPLLQAKLPLLSKS